MQLCCTERMAPRTRVRAHWLEFVRASRGCPRQSVLLRIRQAEVWCWQGIFVAAALRILPEFAATCRANSLILLIHWTQRRTLDLYIGARISASQPFEFQAPSEACASPGLLSVETVFQSVVALFVRAAESVIRFRDSGSPLPITLSRNGRDKKCDQVSVLRGGVLRDLR